MNLNQRRGSELILREALRRDSSRDENIAGIRPLQLQKGGSQHPAVTSRSLSLQAAPSPVTMEKGGPFAKRSRSTKKREGKTQSLICFNNPEGKYLKDLMWDRPVLGTFMEHVCIHYTKKEPFYLANFCLLKFTISFCLQANVFLRFLWKCLLVIFFPSLFGLIDLVVSLYHKFLCKQKLMYNFRWIFWLNEVTKWYHPQIWYKLIKWANCVTIWTHQ